MTRIEAILARAKAATEGPWRTTFGLVEDAPLSSITVNPPFVTSPTDDHDAEFIAALNPETALWLLSLVEGAVEFAENRFTCCSDLKDAADCCDVCQRARAWLVEYRRGA